MNVRDIHAQALSRHGFRADKAQQAALECLQTLCENLAAIRRTRRSVVGRWLSRASAPRGVYLWGGVGRGKSLLLDSFYESAPVRRKIRIHFFEFMRAVHRELDELKGRQNPLDEVARRIARRYRLICLDEFHFSDIADAMILYRLLKRMLDLGTVFVMTSNHRPQDLYPDGLHRDRILPAIALIVERLDVVHVDAGIDYRGRMLEGVRTYLCPTTAATQQVLNATFDLIAQGPDGVPLMVIGGRQIKAVRCASGIVWFDFATLCVDPRSYYDYLELASRFPTMVVSDVCQMNAEMSSEARRFTWLVDVLYDHRVKLLMSAEVLPEELYTGGVLQQEFQRTISRIVEMQSSKYLGLPSRPIQGPFADPERHASAGTSAGPGGNE